MRHIPGSDSLKKEGGPPGTQSAKLVRMERRLAFAFSVAVALAAVLAIDLGACSTDSGGHPALGCQLGAGCSDTQVCTGGIVGCTSNCQCLGGTWQAPCPDDA